MLGADRIFLAEADCIQLIGGHAHRHQIVLGGFGAGIAKRDVVFGRAALVAITLDLQLVVGILLQMVASSFESAFKSADRVRAQRVLVVIEIGVLNAARSARRFWRA